MGIELTADSAKVLVAFALYLVGVAALGVFAHRYMTKGSFVKEYFLGNRGLGPWVLALTLAATAISGGTFMGFPSLIYTNGWVMALWICSYMVVPLTAMVWFGKRINQVARIGGSVTVPDIFRDRFRSPAMGVIGSLLLLVFLCFNLVAQFKAGGLVMKEALAQSPEKVSVLWMTVDKGYLLGLLIFAFTVIAYTTYGGFWAVTWTDVLEGLVMLVGVVVLAVLAVNAVPVLEDRPDLSGLAAATENLRRQDPQLVTGPGPGGFLGFGMALSFFLMWSVGGAGQPSGMVRLMSFKDSKSLSRALVLIGVYYILTYVSLLIIFVCARAIFPTEYLGQMGSEGVPDSIMPAMIRKLSHPLVAGLLLAAPYAAIMSTVAAFLLMISSSLVRDLYQRTINPKASQKALRRISYLTTALVGTAVMVGAINPPAFLQYIIVFTGSGQTCAFFFPMLMTLYWKRATRQGVLAGMLGGGLTVFGLYLLGWIDSGSQNTVARLGEQAPAFSLWLQQNLTWIPGWGVKRFDSFAPLYVGGLDPLVWGLTVSLTATVLGSLWSRPDPELVKKYFP